MNQLMRMTRPRAEGGNSGFPIYRGCNVVTPTIPITTIPPAESTPVCLTIPMVPLRTPIPQPNTGFHLDQLEVYKEKQQVQAHA
jgi:hypothetical protein